MVYTGAHPHSPPTSITTEYKWWCKSRNNCWCAFQMPDFGGEEFTWAMLCIFLAQHHSFCLAAERNYGQCWGICRNLSQSDSRREEPQVPQMSLPSIIISMFWITSYKREAESQYSRKNKRETFPCFWWLNLIRQMLEPLAVITKIWSSLLPEQICHLLYKSLCISPQPTPITWDM